MSKSVTLTVDGITVSVPEGTLVVDAAKRAGINIPVFCYHPKLEPVGMCRMCLVEVGRPVFDRATGEFLRADDGSLLIQFGSKLETACTIPVSEGMQVRGLSEKVARGRKDVLEFLLTSHPLDCPICDKGGECPLQNLTMDFGPGKSRFIYDEKMKLAKHSPLGDLILLDQERCIQCARCIRFQDEIVGDPVIGFSQRGRSLQIVTFSEPSFDSYFSGNTTDICPVGALTTRDFRFGARPWELKAAASICPHCPVGCNLTLNVRRENKVGGEMVIKRVMPRQNEWVNELWICDKGRFGYPFTESEERLKQPLVRKDGGLIPVSWEEAISLVADKFREAGENLLTLVGGRLSNEDLFNLRCLTDALGGWKVHYTHMGGGKLVAQYGLSPGTNLAEIGNGTVILVTACDLREEAPIYSLRVKQAVDRGATLILINPRPTRLDRYATHLLRYPYGDEADIVRELIDARMTKRAEMEEESLHIAEGQDIHAAADALARAENAILFFGSEGAGLAESVALADALAELLIASGHAGKPGSGLIGVWPQANNQGAWDMGFQPVFDLRESWQAAKAAYVVACDPLGDDIRLAETVASPDFLVVQELFLTRTAKLADVVLPAQVFTEREGTFTNGERRVQRYYPAVPPRGMALPDYSITGRIGECLGLDLESRLAMGVMERISAEIPAYAGVTYLKMAEVTEQWPAIGRGDLNYGGTAYENKQGLGIPLPTAGPYKTGFIPASLTGEVQPVARFAGLLAVPISRLYDRGQTLMPSALLQTKIPTPYAILHPQDATTLGIAEGGQAQIRLNGISFAFTACLDEAIHAGVILVPRSLGIPIGEPRFVEITSAERVKV
jgi:NADH-quinone oxidoreductase subunit G